MRHPASYQCAIAAAIAVACSTNVLAEQSALPAALSQLAPTFVEVLSTEEAAKVRGEGTIFTGAQINISSLVFPNAGGLANFSATAGGTAIGLTSNATALGAHAADTFQATNLPGASPQQGLRPSLAGGQTTGDYVFGNGFLYNKATGQGFQFSGGSFIRFNGTQAAASLFGKDFLTRATVQGSGVLNGAPNTLTFKQ